MNNYLLSIDPSMRNTGFTLWENKKPILIKSHSFKNIKERWIWKFYNFKQFIDDDIKKWNTEEFDNLTLIIERGTFHSKNGIGYETQEHLRGFIAGQFNKLLTKDILISPSEWKKWYLATDIVWHDKKGNKLNYKQWDKEVSLSFANHLVITNHWNIKISNHDEADSLLIGWYYLNKENK